MLPPHMDKQAKAAPMSTQLLTIRPPKPFLTRTLTNLLHISGGYASFFR